MDKAIEHQIIMNEIFNDLKGFRSEHLYRCPYCEKIIEWKDVNYNPEENVYTCEHCKNTFDEVELENISMLDFLEEIYLAYKVTNYKEKEND